jgi:hypothetical protein
MTSSAPISRDRFRRFSIASIPMISDAPFSRAPSRRARSGPGENGDGLADSDPSGLGGRDAGRGDVGKQNALLVRHVVGDLGEVGLRVGNAEVVGLDAVDRVAEAPAADHLPLVAVPGALCLDVVLTEEARAARADGADQYTVADLVALDVGAELLDDADGLVAHDAPRSNGVLAAQDVHVGAADRRHRDADEGVVGAALGDRALLERDASRRLEDGGAHASAGAAVAWMGLCKGGHGLPPVV